MPAHFRSPLGWAVRIVGLLALALLLINSRGNCDDCDGNRPRGGTCPETAPFCKDPSSDSSVCVECLEDANCDSGEICTTFGTCSDDVVTCQQDSECGAGLVCTINTGSARGNTGSTGGSALDGPVISRAAGVLLDPGAIVERAAGPPLPFMGAGQSLEFVFSFGSAIDVALLDRDADGKQDVLLTTFGDWQMFLNEGDGNFGDSEGLAGLNIIYPQTAFFKDSPWMVAAEGDYSFGQQPDLVDLSADLGFGIFNDWSDDPDSSAPSNSVAVGDVNGDGLEDMVVGHHRTAVIGDGLPEARVWLRDEGMASFSQGPDLSAAGNFGTHAIALVDVDSDEDLDIVSAHEEAPPDSATKNLVWINQGGDQGGTEGTFTLATSGLGTMSYTTAMAFADLDADGDLDAVLANSTPNIRATNQPACATPPSTPNAIWINQGGDQAGTEGEFADSGVAIGVGASTDVQIVSLQGDFGILFTNLFSADVLYSSNGGSPTVVQTFDHSSEPNGERLHTSAVVAGDVNNDGGDDLIFAIDILQCDVGERGTENTTAGSVVYLQQLASPPVGYCVACTTDGHCGAGETCYRDRCTTDFRSQGATSFDFAEFVSRGGFPFGNGAPPTLDIDDANSGVSTRHVFEFGTAQNDLETFQFVVHYPFDFRWNGFTSLGPPGTEIGRLVVEQSSMTVLDAPFVVFDAGTAFVDAAGSGDPAGQIGLQYQSSSAHRLTTVFPWGGDFDGTTLFNGTTRNFTLELDPGLMANPTVSGDYPLQIEMVSVDPDTDHYDDAQNDNPQNAFFGVTVSVVAVGEIFSDGFESGDTGAW